MNSDMTPAEARNFTMSVEYKRARQWEAADAAKREIDARQAREDRWTQHQLDRLTGKVPDISLDEMFGA